MIPNILDTEQPHIIINLQAFEQCSRLQQAWPCFLVPLVLQHNTNTSHISQQNKCKQGGKESAARDAGLRLTLVATSAQCGIVCIFSRGICTVAKVHGFGESAEQCAAARLAQPVQIPLSNAKP